MDKKDEVIGLVKELTGDIDDRMENLSAIKGEAFVEAVSMCMSMHSMLEIAGAEHVPIEIRRLILCDVAATLMGGMLRKMLDNDADRKEALHFAKNMNNSMSQQAEKITKILKESK